jgi:1-aminocyclopropane-1-carboxylate deaminase
MDSKPLGLFREVRDKIATNPTLQFAQNCGCNSDLSQEKVSIKSEISFWKT